MASNPTIGSGSVANGTYPCVIFKMSDQVTFVPSANDGTGCVSGTSYTIDVCSDFGSGAPQVTDNNGNITTCATASGTEDTVWVYVSTFSSSTNGYSGHNAFAPPATNGDSQNGFNLASEIIISSTTTGTLVFGTDGKVAESNGSCELRSPDFSFSTGTTGGSSSTLPDIGTFSTNPTNQFLVDLITVNDGHLFRGQNATKPHPGAHIYFDETFFDAYAASGNLSDLPKIYAVADGEVAKVDTYFPQTTGNYRYGLLLNIATKNSNTVNINYSIEPFLNPSNSSFYLPFLLVNVGDQVSKGDLIAYMYSSTSTNSADCTGSCDPSSKNAHIHFELNSNGQKMSPSIFTTSVMASFEQQISIVGDRHNDCPLGGGACNDAAYQTCADNGGMGYEISADENPFLSAADSCL